MTIKLKTTPALTLCEIGESATPGLPSYSPFSSKVHRALELHGLAFEREHRAHPGAWKDVNPIGQVPVLRVGERYVADSTRILQEIEEISEQTLVPADPEKAASAWLWEEFADTSLNGFLVAARWADDDNWPLVSRAFFGGFPMTVVGSIMRRKVVASLDARDITRAGNTECWRRFEELLDRLELRAPGSGFWVGNAPSVADVAIWAQLHSLRTELTPRQAEMIEHRRTLAAYLDRVGTASPGSSHEARTHLQTSVAE